MKLITSSDSDHRFLGITIYRTHPNKRPCSKKYLCLSSAKNVILACMNFCLPHWMMQLSGMGSTLKGKNLLLEEEQILP